MGIQPVGYRPIQFRPPGRLNGRSGSGGSIAPGATAILGSFQCPSQGFPVLESLYYDGSAGGDGSLHFFVTRDGARLPYPWASSYNPVGQPGVPAVIGQELPPGGLIEVRCTNESGTTAYDAYSDGEIFCYETQPR